MQKNKENYQIILEETIKRFQKEGKKPTLLLHACCAPCSSYVLEYLADFFDITILFYNPNIVPVSEFSARFAELSRLVTEMDLSKKVKLICAEYDEESFKKIAVGHENDPEGGERCLLCYELRLENSAKYAKDNGYDLLTTTLTISPLKNSQKINEIGAKVAEKYDINYLFSDFKKKNGYLRSVQLTEKYHLYRQNYCGCLYSKNASTKPKD